MATTPTRSQLQFIWRFYSCQLRRYHIVIATSESDARSQLPDAPCLFAARFPSNSPTLSYWRARP
ncbi:host cell division inhibitor Icd-like protein [Salmonella enterica]|uniref:host cell division inhibitor Icd-like protein n=1 Tax=Citrobacter TaxID=544 RepID=UPI002577848A|nr:host cell division inhibitor Icd-like protein [Citrobacter sp. Ce104]EDW6206137.1 host cell division inhibitor Icd-like protein [Salmonella enterica subsp. enterica]EMB3980124.1 host cell division inhibitor Icd-like protein [Salmonella enterica]MDJ7584538.1 host cell division inhibitor Icd-like protein [Salmonella enterica]MDM3277882.1 host cell division inhibitor Icd-like protein [Citrobacter sp. Ce104]